MINENKITVLADTKGLSHGRERTRSIYSELALRSFSGLIMVLIMDGNSEIGAHVRSNLCYLIFLRQLVRSID